MRKFILILIFLSPSLIFAQIQSGEIIYKVEFLDEEKNTVLDTLEPKSTGEQMAKENLADIFEKTERAIPRTTFKLEFTKSEALFKNTSGMDSDNNKSTLSGTQLALAAVGGKGVFYTNLSEDLNIHQRDYLKLVRIHSKISDIKWEIPNEFKTIAGYQCQKAKN